MNTRFVVTLLTFLPLSLFAHPGHEALEDQGLIHYLTSPLHLSSLVLAIIVAGVIYWRFKLREKPQQNSK